MDKIFSAMELIVFKAINEDKLDTISKIVAHVYWAQDYPNHPSTVIGSAIKRINTKARRNKLKFRIDMIGDKGPKGKKIKLVRY